MPQLLQRKRQQKKMHEVTYSVFRETLGSASGQRVKNKHNTTVVYDANNHLLAMLKNASIDSFGRSRPTQYFVANAV